MRYLSWDVLLFPANSRVPLQEFNTQCHVLPDQSNRLIDNAVLNSNPYLREIESMAQIPVLNTFVSSLEQGSAFRVSIHSWEPPKPSQILRTFKTHEECVAYEARLYIDGDMATQRIFNEQTFWPEVIESTDADSSHSKLIRFPAFHSEILDQAHWEPGEAYGRIRVVIAEGVTRQDNSSGNPSSFDRLRDLVAFSFQHAPRSVLEYSGIAWPNARLFRRNLNVVGRGTIIPDFDAHAHSPQRSRIHDSTTTLVGTIISPSGVSRESKTTYDVEDPFVDTIPISLRSRQVHPRRGSNDASVKDYNSIRTVRSHAGTDMSGISYQKPDFERAMNEAAIDEIVQALSPEKKNDLLQALSPSRGGTTTLGGSGGSESELDIVRGDSGPETRLQNTIPMSRDLKQIKRTNVARGNLLASKYASMPFLPSATTASRPEDATYGLRNTNDPLLLTVWNQSPQTTEDSSDPIKAISDLRPRSISSSSKRKRQDSPGVQSPKEPIQLPSMSTSPCKSTSVTPLYLNTESPTEGGVTLEKQR